VTAASLARRGAAPYVPPLPATITGLQFWLDAANLPVVADGTNLTTWPDRSTFGRNAVGAGTPAKYYSGVVNGKPVVRWTIADTHFDSTAPSSDPSQTILVVASLADTTGDHTFTGPDAATAPAFYASGTGLDVQNYGVSFPGLAPGAGLVAGTFFVATTSFTSGACTFWKDGTQVGTDTGTYSFTARTTRVGMMAGAAAMKGDIAEILRYDSVLSGANRIALHAYLGAKYGITMGGA
jgi:hypothetical protein